MKNKNTFTNWRQLFRRTLAVSLSIAMFGNMVDLSTLSVDAQTTEELLSTLCQKTYGSRSWRLEHQRMISIFPIR